MVRAKNGERPKNQTEFKFPHPNVRKRKKNFSPSLFPPLFAISSIANAAEGRRALTLMAVVKGGEKSKTNSRKRRETKHSPETVVVVRGSSSSNSPMNGGEGNIRPSFLLLFVDVGVCVCRGYARRRWWLLIFRVHATS